MAIDIHPLQRASVLVVGDAMLDHFVHGEVRRISPEAPIPVFNVGRVEVVPGGAGNVARNIAALGARAILIAVVGDDAEGATLVDLVGHDDRIVPRLVVATGRPTTLKTRYVAGTQQVLRVDREMTSPIAPEIEDHVFARAKEALAEADIVVLSDYAKGMLAPGLIARLIDLARSVGKPVLVDPKGYDVARYAGATVLTPNRAELAEATGRAVDGDGEIVEAARVVLERARCAAVLVTRGPDGMSLVPREGDPEHLPTQAREVFDVAGAGDTVIAAFAAALGAGLPMLDAARLANVAAGIVVGKAGTAVVHPEEISLALDAAATSKLVGLATARDRVTLWRRRGARIAFTNGCFDLLHPGHISLLNQAKAAGDRLVVGLNADAGVARLKGPGRPVQSEVARAQVLASLTVVDLVVVFEEDTPIRLIEALRPEVLVKGADYRLDQVVGGDLVARWGGRVVLVDLTPGYSTTETIKRLGR